MNPGKRLYRWIKEHPLSIIIVGWLGASLVMWLYTALTQGLRGELYFSDLLEMLWVLPIVAAFLIVPVLLSIYNVFYLLQRDHSPKVRRGELLVEGATVLIGGAFTWLWGGIGDIQWDSDWWVQLYNDELHTPVATWTAPTLWVLAGVGLLGYLLCRLLPLKKTPPLVMVVSLGGLYVGAALCLVWCIQMAAHDIVLCVYPVNLLVIFAATVRDLLLQWRELPPQETKPALSWLQRLLHNAANWPWLGLVSALPLLGLVIAVLTLFGQAPDAVIQAWTQTSDWTFSQQIAPENLPMDMHYLCTVAAGGHRKVVKPLRMGKRHGHRVLVNRQLCVANAFEELLMEQLPRFHRCLRNFYDRYGYPIARHIRSPLAADVVWVLMKPLEWFFLGVLYLFDTRPENRIAVQYPHSRPPKR